MNLLACVAGNEAAQPKCLAGWRNGGAHHRCFKSCENDEPCPIGACRKTPTGQNCM